MTQQPLLPRIPAWRVTGTTQVLAWCEPCRCYHNHGVGLQERPGGHRGAHCPTVRLEGRRSVPWKSPYYDTGYYLIDQGDATKEIILDSERKRPHGPHFQQGFPHA